MFFSKHLHLPSQTNPVRQWVKRTAADFENLFASKTRAVSQPAIWEMDHPSFRTPWSGFEKIGTNLDAATAKAAWCAVDGVEIFHHPTRGFYAIDATGKVVGGIIDGCTQTSVQIAASHSRFVEFFATCFSILHEKGWNTDWPLRQPLFVPQRPDLTEKGFYRHIFHALQDTGKSLWDDTIVPEIRQVEWRRRPIHEIPLADFAKQTTYRLPDSDTDERDGISFDWDESWKIVDLHNGYTARYRSGAKFYLIVDNQGNIVGRCGNLGSDIPSFGSVTAAAYLFPKHRGKGLYAAALEKLWDNTDCLRMEMFAGAGYTQDTYRSHKAIHRRAILEAIDAGKHVPAYALYGHDGLVISENSLTRETLLTNYIDRFPQPGDRFVAVGVPQRDGPTTFRGNVYSHWNHVEIKSVPSEQTFFETYGVLKVLGHDGVEYWLSANEKSGPRRWHTVETILPADRLLSMAQEAGCDDDEIEEWVQRSVSTRAAI